MIHGQKVLGLIPARGGSKGVIGKNLRMLGGKPLLVWTIEAAKASKYMDAIVLSSDDEAIMAVARQHGCDVPFKRPAALARDESPTFDAIQHAIENLPSFDKIVILQATSPLRLASDIDRCLEISMQHSMCVSVTKTTKSPYWAYKMDTEGKISPLIKTEATRRQDLPETYIPNGCVFVADVKELMHSKTFFTDKTVGYEMPASRSMDLDTEDDFEYLEYYLTRRLNSTRQADYASL